MGKLTDGSSKDRVVSIKQGLMGRACVPPRQGVWLVFVCVGVALLLGCSIPRKIKAGRVLGEKPLPRDATYLILGIRDAQETGQPVAVGSGKALASAIQQRMLKEGIAAETTAQANFTDGMNEAKARNIPCVIKAEYTLWEDNATAWSGRGDKVAISLEAYDVSTGRMLAASSFKRVATGFTFASDSPFRFLAQAADGAVGTIFKESRD